jgi:hypothetical protein
MVLIMYGRVVTGNYCRWDSSYREMVLNSTDHAGEDDVTVVLIIETHCSFLYINYSP